MDSEPFDDPPSVLISAKALRTLVDGYRSLYESESSGTWWAKTDPMGEAVDEAESALERYK